MQRREPGARRDRQREPDAAPDHRPFLGQLLLAEQEHARDQHEDREEIGGFAEQQERDVGEPRAGRSHSVRHGAFPARDAERGIDRAIAREREQQNEAHARENPEGGLAKPPDPRHEEGLESRAALGFIQVMR